MVNTIIRKGALSASEVRFLLLGLALFILLSSCSHDSTISQPWNRLTLDKAMSGISKRLVEQGELQGKMVLVSPHDFYDRESGLSLPLATLLRERMVTNLLWEGVRVVLPGGNEDGLMILQGTWQRHKNNLLLDMKVMKLGDMGPEAVSAASATISLNEIDPKALSPDKASWARYLVRRLERKSHDQTPRTVHLRNFKLVGASGGTVDSEGHFSEWIRTALNDSRLFRPLDQQAGMRKIPMETIRLRAIDVASKSQGSSTGLTTDLLRAEAELTGSVWLHEKRNIAEIHVWIKKRGGTDIAAATAEIPSNLFPETIIDPPAKPPVPPAPPNIVGPVGTISVKGQTVDITSTRGEGKPFYRIGEKIRIIVRLNQKAYTYLFNLGPHGKASLLYPVESDGSLVRGRHPVLEAGEALILPEDSATYTWAAAAPYGKETVWAVATEHPLTLPASLSREWAQSQILIERIREQGLRGDDRYAEAQIELITGP